MIFLLKNKLIILPASQMELNYFLVDQKYTKSVTNKSAFINWTLKRPQAETSIDHKINEFEKIISSFKSPKEWIIKWIKKALISFFCSFALFLVIFYSKVEIMTMEDQIKNTFVNINYFDHQNATNPELWPIKMNYVLTKNEFIFNFGKNNIHEQQLSQNRLLLKTNSNQKDKNERQLSKNGLFIEGLKKWENKKEIKQNFLEKSSKSRFQNLFEDSVVKNSEVVQIGNGAVHTIINQNENNITISKNNDKNLLNSTYKILSKESKIDLSLILNKTLVLADIIPYLRLEVEGESYIIVKDFINEIDISQRIFLFFIMTNLLVVVLLILFFILFEKRLFVEINRTIVEMVIEINKSNTWAKFLVYGDYKYIGVKIRNESNQDLSLNNSLENSNSFILDMKNIKISKDLSFRKELTIQKEIEMSNKEYNKLKNK